MSKNEPRWAQDIRDWGQELKDKIKTNQKKKPWEKRGERIGDFIGNFIALLIINIAPVWWPDFFTSSYPGVLTVVNTVILMQIIISAIMLIFSIKWIYYLGQSATNLLGFISLVTIMVIFPFNVPYGLSYLVRLGLCVAGFITIISSVVYLIKAFLAVFDFKK
jgi:hypothetical protein